MCVGEPEHNFNTLGYAIEARRPPPGCQQSTDVHPGIFSGDTGCDLHSSHNVATAGFLLSLRSSAMTEASARKRRFSLMHYRNTSFELIRILVDRISLTKSQPGDLIRNVDNFSESRGFLNLHYSLNITGVKRCPERQKKGAETNWRRATRTPVPNYIFILQYRTKVHMYHIA